MTLALPSKSNEEANRMWASASFVGVLIVIGLPLWWKTTEVYRVSLPYNEINSLHKLPQSMATGLTILADDERKASDIAKHIKNFFEDYEYLRLNIKWAVLPHDIHNAVNKEEDDQLSLEALAQYHALTYEDNNLTKENHILLVQKKQLKDHVWVSNKRVVFFKDYESTPTVIQVLAQWIYQTDVLAGARSDVAGLARRTRFPPSDGFHIVLTVIHPRPDTLQVKFDAEHAVEDYIGTFVDELSFLHNFTLKSQWLYMMNFDFQTKQVKDESQWGHHFATKQERLPLLLTSIEERAATNAAEEPTINLALYITPCDQAPIVIYDSQDKPVTSKVQAFMSPKWGGVFISNPTSAECKAKVHEPSVKTVMGTFLAQLRRLLGIDELPPIAGARVAALRSVLPREWERERVVRLRTLEHLTAAKNTLRSLARLLGEISNIVINDEVGESIKLAVEKIHLSTKLMEGGKIKDAYEASQLANRAAETAFTDPSLLALLYFPDDQKYAIYIPLFLPVMFPVILSFKTLVLWFRGEPIKKDKMD